jgi:predicted ATPase
MKKLLIKNFKCFEEQEIELGNLTLLAGANGSGKSTVIQVMLLFLQSMLNDDKSHTLTNLFLNGYYFTGISHQTK